MSCRMNKPSKICAGPGSNTAGMFCNDAACPVNTGLEPRTSNVMVLVPRELLREARDNCLASIAEDGISSHRKDYRADLYRRLNAALADGVVEVLRG